MRSSMLCAALVFFASALHADISTTDPTLGPLTFLVGTADNFQQLIPDATVREDGFVISSGQQSSEGEWFLAWDLAGNIDPFINGVFAFTNVSATTQSFIVAVFLPVTPIGPSTLIGGSIGVTVTDSNFNGVATVSDSGTAIYTAQIDGSDVGTLFDSPYSLSAPFAGGSATDSDFAGLPGPFLPGPAAASSIGIVHRFDLTPGDSVAFTSFFVVEPVPEMGSVWFAGLALAGIVGARTWRKRTTDQ